jgi:hypothetical protein
MENVRADIDCVHKTSVLLCMSIDLSSDQPSRRRTSAGTYCFRCRNPRYAFFIFILKDCTACGSGNSSKVSQDGRQKPERPSAVFASVATAAAVIHYIFSPSRMTDPSSVAGPRALTPAVFLGCSHASTYQRGSRNPRPPDPLVFWRQYSA